MLLNEAREPFPPEALPGRLVLAGNATAEAVVCFRSAATDQERWSIVTATPIRNAFRENRPGRLRLEAPTSRYGEFHPPPMVFEASPTHGKIKNNAVSEIHLSTLQVTHLGPPDWRG